MLHEFWAAMDGLSTMVARKRWWRMGRTGGNMTDEDASRLSGHGGARPIFAASPPTMPQKSRQNRNRKRKATLKLVKRMIAREEREQAAQGVAGKEAPGKEA